jgi:hypothetical protein
MLADILALANTSPDTVKILSSSDAGHHVALCFSVTDLSDNSTFLGIRLLPKDLSFTTVADLTDTLWDGDLFEVKH